MNAHCKARGNSHRDWKQLGSDFAHRVVGEREEVHAPLELLGSVVSGNRLKDREIRGAVRAKEVGEHLELDLHRSAEFGVGGVADMRQVFEAANIDSTWAVRSPMTNPSTVFGSGTGCAAPALEDGGEKQTTGCRLRMRSHSSALDAPKARRLSEIATRAIFGRGGMQRARFPIF